MKERERDREREYKKKERGIEKGVWKKDMG